MKGARADNMEPIEADFSEELEVVIIEDDEPVFTPADVRSRTVPLHRKIEDYQRRLDRMSRALSHTNRALDRLREALTAPRIIQVEVSSSAPAAPRARPRTKAEFLRREVPRRAADHRAGMFPGEVPRSRVRERSPSPPPAPRKAARRCAYGNRRNLFAREDFQSYSEESE